MAACTVSAGGTSDSGREQRSSRTGVPVASQSRLTVYTRGNPRTSARARNVVWISVALPLIGEAKFTSALDLIPQFPFQQGIHNDGARNKADWRSAVAFTVVQSSQSRLVPLSILLRRLLHERQLVFSGFGLLLPSWQSDPHIVAVWLRRDSFPILAFVLWATRAHGWPNLYLTRPTWVLPFADPFHADASFIGTHPLGVLSFCD
ncbi:hypothetical protein R1flu_009845 [Riccia fluitans]|uniref:Uncharacterized protein n=1 Tax=Riccia fluitans TaxID=41844 RepID=A0ABD1Z444_9MARC